MFSLSKIKNIKNILFILLLLPTFIDCSQNMFLSEKTVVPARLPGVAAGSIIVAKGVVGTAILMMLKSDNSQLAISAGCTLVSSAIIYKYLRYFTPMSKLNKATEILEKIDKKMQKEEIWKNLNKNESDSIMPVISKKYPAEDYPTIKFLKNDLAKMTEKTERAQKLLSSLDSFDVKEDSTVKKKSVEKSLIQKIKDKIISWLNNIETKNSLQPQLSDKKEKVQEISKKLGALSAKIREDKNFDAHLESFNTQKIQTPFYEAKTAYLRNQNSYTNNLLNSLCANAFFMNNLYNIIVYFINSISS